MKFVRHHETCSGRPSPAGLLTGKCDCKVAPMDEASRQLVEAMIETIDNASMNAEEAREYFALRLDMLAEVFTQEARQVRRRARIDGRAAPKKRKS